MTVPLTGAGSLFVRLGHWMGRLLDVDALRGSAIVTARVLSTANLPTLVLGTSLPDYANGTAIPQIIASAQADLAAYQQTMGSYLLNLQTYCQNTLQAMYGIDQLAISSKAPASAFASISLSVAMQVLIAQMNTAAASLQQATVSAGAQTAAGTPNGNPVIVVSLKNGNGLTLQLPFPETLTFICTQDSQSGATLGNEQITITGQATLSDPFSWLYPMGSGIQVNYNAVSGTDNNANGNMLVNGDFFVYSTANYPDNWVIKVGTAGVQFADIGTPYTTGGGVLEMIGDGSTLSSISQNFATTSSTAAGVGGTPATFKPNAIYHFNGWLKVSAVPAAGVLRIALVDGTGTVINDAAGTPNSKSLTLSTATTSYVAINGAFRTPNVLPAAVAFNIAQTTAIDNGKNIFLGRFSFTEVDINGNSTLYPGGPFVSIHSGNTMLLDGLLPDQWTVAISNNYATNGSGQMQFMMDRIFGLRTLAVPALQLPVSGSPSVSDALIL